MWSAWMSLTLPCELCHRRQCAINHEKLSHPFRKCFGRDG